jgi:hypothetical protein
MRIFAMSRELGRFGYRLPPMAHNGGLIPETSSRIDLYLMPLRS